MRDPSAIDQHAFVLAGLPGSGKSTAAETIEAEINYSSETATHTEVSDFVRAQFEAAHDGESATDNELGAWAAEMKEQEGQDYFVREMAEIWHDDECPHPIISGVRSPAEAEAVRDVFGAENTTVIAIWTLPDKRFERKYGAKPSADHHEWETFQERNDREIHEWGCVEFFVDSDLYDYILPNNGSKAALEVALDVIIRHDIHGKDFPPEWREDFYPFPKRDPETVAQYL